VHSFFLLLFSLQFYRLHDVFTEMVSVSAVVLHRFWFWTRLMLLWTTVTFSRSVGFCRRSTVSLHKMAGTHNSKLDTNWSDSYSAPYSSTIPTPLLM